MSTNRSRSASAFRDRNTDDLLPERLCTLSRILVKLCRHRATDHGITPTRTGWLPVGQVLAQANHEHQSLHRKAKGKGRGGGNAPAPADLEKEFTIHEVVQIAHRARRPRLGLMENHDGFPIRIRAWDFHAGLRVRQALADYDFESHPVAPTLHPQLPRVAMISAKYRD